MDPRAVAGAKERLDQAREAVTGLHKPTTFSQTRRDWLAFLIAANGVYQKLEKGAKTYHKSREWYRKLKELRKTDELLRYVYRARNAEEHGLDPSVQFNAPKLEIANRNSKVAPENKGKQIVIHTNEDKEKDDPRRPSFRVTLPDKLHLVTVKDDRFGDEFPVPSYHLGKKLESGPIAAVCDMVIEFLDAAIKEASALPK